MQIIKSLAQQTSEKRLSSVNAAIILLIIASVFLNIVTLKDGHNWGADFAQYIIHAKNVLAHKPFTDGIMLDNPFSYPPGFPWLIAPVIKIFGVNFIVLKFLNIIFWYLSLLFLYLIFRPRLGSTLALLGCLVLAFSADFFFYKQNILSDIPFLFVITAAVYVFLSRRPFQLYLVLLILAYLIRTAGIVLFIATIYYLIVKEKNWCLAGWVLMAMILAIGIHIAVVGFHPDFVAIAAQDPLSFLVSLKAKMAIPPQSIFLFFCPESTAFTHEVFTAAASPLIYLSPWIYLLLLGGLVYKTIRGNISLVEIFILVYFFALLSWTTFETNPHTLVRLFIPITGFLLMSALAFLKKINFEDLAKFLLSVVVCLNLFNIFHNLKFNDDVLYSKENQELFSWVKENIGSDEHYVFWEPRTLALMTERVGTAPVTPSVRPRSDFLTRMNALNVTYFIMIKPVDQSLIQSLESNPHLFQLRWENIYYKIFQIKNKKH